MTIYYEVPETFQEWRRFAGYSKAQCVDTFGVTRRTINSWESGKIKPPRAVFICLGLFAGRLDHLGKRWRGFRITPECIEAPNGDFVRCEEISALRYAMFALDMRRDRRCRMNEDETGEIKAPDILPINVTFIDKAPKKAQKVKNHDKKEDSQPPILLIK